MVKVERIPVTDCVWVLTLDHNTANVLYQLLYRGVNGPLGGSRDRLAHIAAAMAQSGFQTDFQVRVFGAATIE